MEGYFGKLRKQAEIAHEISRRNRVMEKIYMTQSADGVRRWPVFDKNMYPTFDNLVSVDGLQEMNEGMKKDGSVVFGIDLMGQGKPCINAGCDEAISVTLDSDAENSDVELAQKLSEFKIEVQFGDIFSKETATKLISEVESRVNSGQKLSLVYFRPIAGLNPYKNLSPDYTFSYLTERYLKPIFNLLEPGGKILVSLMMLQDSREQKDFYEALKTTINTLENVDVIFDDKKGSTNFAITKNEVATA